MHGVVVGGQRVGQRRLRGGGRGLRVLANRAMAAPPVIRGRVRPIGDDLPQLSVSVPDGMSCANKRDGQ